MTKFLLPRKMGRLTRHTMHQETIHAINDQQGRQSTYRGADKSLARPGRKQATATEDSEFIYHICYHKWRNIGTIDVCMYKYIHIFT
jgi:hypothetical protein